MTYWAVFQYPVSYYAIIPAWFLDVYYELVLLHTIGT